MVEVLIVVATVALLTTIVIVALDGTREKARDVQRQSDLRILQAAVETYRQQNGRYPAQGCSSGTDGFATEAACANYIQNLSVELPQDPNRGTGDGYAYYTNSAGTSYKIMAMNTVESETVTDQHEFSSCSFEVLNRPASFTSGWASVVMCDQVISSGNNRPQQCQISDNRFQRSYAVWGGFATKATSNTGTNFSNSGSSLDLTQQVWCR